MPQGGAGKCGGNLMSSGNSKKKMSSKPRVSSSKTSHTTGKVMVPSEPLGFEVFRPDKEKRAQVMRAQRAALEAERRRTAPQGRGKHVAKGGGQKLGSGDATTGGDVADLRMARLLCFEQQQHASSAESAGPPSASSSEAPGSASGFSDLATVAYAYARRCAYEELHDDEMSAEVLLLLDLAAERLSHEAMEQSHKVLCTVLRNVISKGGPEGDCKYRTLRESNDKLWVTLLSHPEMVAVLGAAGFEQQATEHPAPRSREPATSNEPSTQADAGLQQQMLQLALEEQLEHEAESLVCRLQELSERASGPTVATSEAPGDSVADDESATVDGGASPSSPRSLISRRDWVHPGVASENALADLNAVLDAVTAWCFVSALANETSRESVHGGSSDLRGTA